MWPPSSCLWLALVLLVGVAQGQSGSREHFEDADKSSEYTDQQYDLRHTIPGEPGLDYPILSSPPKTSFVCKGRHEGYYADVESRCQAFRICAHTARSPQGFGFLCPNGTIFSQKNFVCDWYRNVNCDDSERYYEMNEEKTVGSTHEMMERVRHMMEYPMKTISKALQQTQSQSQNPHHSLSKDLSGASGVLSQHAAIKPNDPETQVVGRGEDVKSEPLNAEQLGSINPEDSEDEGIYVNSLGELSSDPGIQFDHTNAHIVAEYPREYHYQKQKNFAERVNAGLDILTDSESNSGEAMAPDYIKHIRNTKDEAVQLDLVSNINNLLDEVSTDVDPSVSGYQSMAPPKVKQPFRFLSRGFSMQGENGKGSSSSGYGYIKPKQTPSTVRFTNFKSAQSQGSNQGQQHQRQQQQQHQVAKQQHHSVSSSYVKPAAAPAISSLTVPPHPQQTSQSSVLPPPPGIVIARAEGQRIAPNSASNIISSLATQAPVTSNQGNSYVSLNDFLNNKFGQSPAASSNVHSPATLQQQQRVPQQQPQYQQQATLSLQQQQRHPVLQQQHQPVEQQRQPVQQQLSFISQQYQQPQQQSIYQQYKQAQQQQQQQQHFQQQQQRTTIHTNQQPYLTPNIFVPYHQQQQQLPQFPPLAPPVAVSTGNIAQGPVIAGRHVDHLNVQLPTLPNGLIPGLQLAQKRSDVSSSQLQLTDTKGKGSFSGSGKSRERAFYAGRTSYDVPQSSVGRLPNDITQQLRRRLRRF
ncbi:negative elongation factor A isoform X2 [Drosophila sechellia]|uniref:negative elongation factor A isoform X2 n=1 Tax=Drosophila sechellia TaxID=7238 RepID=UPI0013DE05C6|nr:negative elongation factor A isoform X2 [Drosophila sechellia]